MRWIAKIVVFTVALIFGLFGTSFSGALRGSGLSDCVVKLSPKPIASSQPPKRGRVMYAGWQPESGEGPATLEFVVYNGLDVPVTYQAYAPTEALPEVHVDGKKFELWRCVNGIEEFQIALFYRRSQIPGATAQPPILSFPVNADSYPPTNVHVLIGRNGVGKSRCLTDLSASFVSAELGEGAGQIIVEPEFDDELSVSSVITFSFSLFDLPIYKTLESR